MSAERGRETSERAHAASRSRYAQPEPAARGTADARIQRTLYVSPVIGGASRPIRTPAYQLVAVAKSAQSSRR